MEESSKGNLICKMYMSHILAVTDFGNSELLENTGQTSDYASKNNSTIHVKSYDFIFILFSISC